MKNRKLVLVGKRIYLRKIKPTDATRDYYYWMNDKKITQFTEARFNNYTIPKLKLYIKKINQQKNNIFLAIILKENNQHIGNIKLSNIDSNHRFADVGIIIGDKSCWNKGYATEAIKLIRNFAFKQLKLHKLTAGCYANNIGAIKAFKNVGFKQEGRLKEHYLYRKNRYVDRICLGLVNPK